jgi:hypothetical protein
MPGRVILRLIILYAFIGFMHKKGDNVAVENTSKINFLMMATDRKVGF